MKITTTKIKRTIEIDFRMSIAKIARICGVSRTTVYNWKAGRYFPHPKHIELLKQIKDE
jgi:DNA-binding transcriptional regulator YiaG